MIYVVASERVAVVRHASYFGLWASGYHIYLETMVNGEMRSSAILFTEDKQYYRAKTLREALWFARTNFDMKVIVDTKRDR